MPVAFTFDSRKAIAAIVYLGSKQEQVSGLDKYKAAKLIFLADKFHLVRHGKPIVGDSYRALDYGPVPQNVLDLLHAITATEQPVEGPARALAEMIEVDRTFHYPRLRARSTPPLDLLSTSEVEALDHVVAVYGRKTFDQLKAITHEMACYRKAWETRRTGGIAPMSYEEFFEEDSDALAGAYDEMLENDALRRAFPGDVGI